MSVADGDYRKKYKKYNIQIIFEDKFKKDKKFDDKDAQKIKINGSVYKKQYKIKIIQE